ncbi:MAG: hypothetical protein PHT31_02540 [Candidatus Omnitrophica bacterium]|nr:hypothetical protein [Candidatus Omnitrophota bacterium]MDD5653026.1 hypothetical protein [Candidatus Omnitrophota bacterium]
MNRIALKASLIIGVAFFLGFYLILPLRLFIPSYGVLALVDIVFFMASGQFYIGIGLSFLVGLFFYFFFKYLIIGNIAKKYQYWLLVLMSIIVLIIGFFVYIPVQDFISKRQVQAKKEGVWKIDTNNDGKTDRWAYYDANDKLIRVDYDTNFDGEVDIREYYKNNKIIEKEIDSDFDGTFDKIEK